MFFTTVARVSPRTRNWWFQNHSRPHTHTLPLLCPHKPSVWTTGMSSASQGPTVMYYLAQPPYKVFVSRWTTLWSTGELRPNKGMLNQYYVDILTEGIPGTISRKTWGVNKSSTSEAEVEESWAWSQSGKPRKQVNDSNNSHGENSNNSATAIEQ